MKTASQIRESFLHFFEERGHQRVQSSSLVPRNDPSLLFTNAGMNQFKEVFLGLDQREYKRAVTSQKCMRVSGKHNDLETVGRTARHHTFFEMLGNFSFGDYFKKEAIEYAWELCTGVYSLDPKRFMVTVYEQDEEALQIWRDHIGIAPGRIFRMGEKDNFWAMGETGPCGPCSELHYDIGDRIGDTTSGFLEETGRFIEIWNLVFMQFNRDQSGATAPLPRPSIDTGLGLERITCVLQEVRSNWETDLFRPLIEEAGRLTGIRYGETESGDVSLRILADHSRACMFLIADGVVPGNEGRGYVLRKILRRAIRHGKMLGRQDSFIYTLTALAAELMKDAYPELETSRDHAARLVKNEEEKFSETLSHGLQLLEEICQGARCRGHSVLPGPELFRLYDTYGFPFDLAREIAQEQGFQVDEAGFQTELEKQRTRARASWKGGEKSIRPVDRELASRGLHTEFTGYSEIADVQARVLAIVEGDETVGQLAAGQTGEVVLDRTPFYAEAGGQVGDCGLLENEALQARVVDVYSPHSDLRLHKVEVRQGILRLNDVLRATVFAGQRRQTAANHTATHLLHAALREVLGEHVRQAGSLVAPDRLRFDFTHYKALSSEDIRRLEEIVNQKIRENIRLQTEIKDLDSAVAEGAMALFGEKYDQRVRVVHIPGFSQELCGGTHVERTGDIAVFKVVSENSISSGVRRIEAITGEKALERFLEDESLLARLADDLHTRHQELPQTVERLVRDLKESARRIEQLQMKLARKETGDIAQEAREVRGVRVLSQRVEELDRNAFRRLADQLKNQLKSGVVVLGMPSNGKASLIVMVTADLIDRLPADRLIRSLAPLIDGGGGGRPDMAEAGGKNPAALDSALEQSYVIVEETLAGEGVRE